MISVSTKMPYQEVKETKSSKSQGGMKVEKGAILLKGGNKWQVSKKHVNYVTRSALLKKFLNV